MSQHENQPDSLDELFEQLSAIESEYNTRINNLLTAIEEAQETINIVEEESDINKDTLSQVGKIYVQGYFLSAALARNFNQVVRLDKAIDEGLQRTATLQEVVTSLSTLVGAHALLDRLAKLTTHFSTVQLEVKLIIDHIKERQHALHDQLESLRRLLTPEDQELLQSRKII